jgi:Protein of unknown function (DUF2934)
MMADPSRKSATKAGSEPQNIEEQIRHRAYELYEARGREKGHDMDDWLRAEAEVTSTAVKVAA